MILLPPGCTVAYGITIDIAEMTDDIVEWYRLIEGEVSHKEEYNHRGVKKVRSFVAYNSKKCHYMADGTGNIRLHFLGKDASIASMFLLKFNDCVVRHNLKEVNELQY